MSLRCAIYTRKSSEEGLEQEFNSLAAQREACEAYIVSQRSEGWTVLSDTYDDGGISGGTLERPALQRLLSDVDAGRIDIVVVYKIDRLTRALTDFARLIDQFDAHEVSVVAVTQPFNTTTSMGRLTLNVLLSFAQFEREITGERIRDKIAASKQKGMWMGGCVPLGYDLDNRRLIVNETEAAQVRHIYARYLALGSVHYLRKELASEGITSKVRVGQKSGKQRGGTPFSRGALYPLLQNRLYIGEITHQGQSYPGQHEGIIDPALFDTVQNKLEQQRRSRGRRGATISILAGKLYDGQGNRLTPAHSTKGGKRYRYYVSQEVLYGGTEKKSQMTRVRWPAEALESFIRDAIRDRLQLLHIECMHPMAHGLPDPSNHDPNSSDPRHKQDRADTQKPELLALLQSATLTDTSCTLTWDADRINELTKQQLSKTDREEAPEPWTVPLTVQACHNGRKRIIGPNAPPEPNEKLIQTLADAHRWYEELARGQRLADIAESAKRDIRHVKRTIGLIYLAPDIKQQILEGTQPSDMTLQALTRKDGIPIKFSEQRRLWGIARD